jgi:acyl-CoA thioesterase FadM
MREAEVEPTFEALYAVSMVDVDRVQLHFTRIFIWMDAQTSGLFALLGQPIQRILSDGFGTPVVDAHCKYLSPVMLGDELLARSCIASAGRTSFVVEHTFHIEDRLVAKGELTHVWITGAGGAAKALPLPGWLHAGAANRECRQAAD